MGFPRHKKKNRKHYPKTINAVRVEKAPKIDGILDDEIWKNAPIANDFIELRPNNGKAENPDFKTEVKVAYDDTGFMFLR